MSRYLLLPLASAALLALSAPARAQAIDPDVRCFLLSNLFAGAEKDPAKKQLAGASASFYLGRIDARMSPDQLRTRFAALNKSVTKQNAGPLMNACAKQVQAKHQAVVAMGRSLAAAQQKK